MKDNALSFMQSINSKSNSCIILCLFLLIMLWMLCELIKD